MCSQEGVIIEGYFANNELNGYARIINKDASWLEGYFKDNKRHGSVKCVDIHGKQEYGYWINDKYAKITNML